MRRPNHTFRGDSFFPPWLQLYVNRSDEGFALTMHDHDFVEFVYIAEGKGFHHIENDVHPVRRGDFCIIPIGVPHVFRPTAPDPAAAPLVVYNCVASAELLQRLGRFAVDPDIAAHIASLTGPEFRYISGADTNGTVGRLFLELHREFTFPLAGAADALCALLMRLIVALRRETSGSGPAASPAASAASAARDFVELLDYVERNAHRELTLSALAAIGRWSERHLQRLFRRHTGRTFAKYVQGVRMRLSCDLLRDTDWKVSAVAEAVGYKDIGAFNAAFKRVTGVTPRQYRSAASAAAAAGTADS